MTLYERILRDRFPLLHPTLRSFLATKLGGSAEGPFTVTRAPGIFRRMAARFLGLPPAGEYEVRLVVMPRAKGERWIRHIGRYTLATNQAEHQGLMVETSGPGSIGFELVVDQGGLLFRPRRAWFLGLPLPLWLSPSIEAENWPDGLDGWRVVVRFRIPLLGAIGQYEGTIKANMEPNSSEFSDSKN